MSGEQLPVLKSKAYKDQVFCWIENGETDKVKRFIDLYESHAKSFVTMNNWNLPMFACRYGNLELLQYLIQKKFVLDQIGQQYTLVHAACFGNELDILKYLLDILKKEPVSHSDIQPPLKVCVKAENYALSELLISRGAYFSFKKFGHNILEKAEPNHQYKTFQRSKGEVNEIGVPDSMVLTLDSVPKDSSMYQFLKFIRIKNFMYAKSIDDGTQIVYQNDEQKKENFSYLLKSAFSSQVSQSKILEFLVGEKKKRIGPSDTIQPQLAQNVTQYLGSQNSGSLTFAQQQQQQQLQQQSQQQQQQIQQQQNMPVQSLSPAPQNTQPNFPQ